MAKRYKLSDVAAAAGVSGATVSRILNNKLGNGFSVTPEVRQRVLEAAKRLNYRPSLIARSLTMKSLKMVSILGGAEALADLGNIYQTLVNSMADSMDSLHEGFDVTVDMSKHADDESELPAWRIDGAIILVRCSTPTREGLKQSGIPYVVINGYADESEFFVGPDDVAGTKLAVKHLYELGHRRLAYSGPIPKHVAGHSSISNRHNTFMSELSRLGLKPVEGLDTVLYSASEFLELAVLQNKATGVLAYGHMEGLNLMQAAHSLGIAIPQQLSLLCFCDVNASNVMSPGLTCIDLHSVKMGHIATEMLCDQMKALGGIEPRHVKVSERLFARKTTAPPTSVGP